MSKTTTKRKRFRTLVHRAARVTESTVLLFGNINDPEVQQSKKRIEISGRQTEIVTRPNFDTGVGPCGKHVCSCKTVCLAKYGELEVQYGVNSTGTTI